MEVMQSFFVVHVLFLFLPFQSLSLLITSSSAGIRSSYLAAVLIGSFYQSPSCERNTRAISTVGFVRYIGTRMRVCDGVFLEASCAVAD